MVKGPSFKDHGLKLEQIRNPEGPYVYIYTYTTTIIIKELRYQKKIGMVFWGLIP